MNEEGLNGSAATPPRQPARFAVLDSPIAGKGAFAMQPIAKDETIVEYVGERISKEESNRRCEEGNPYVFQLDDEWDLDGNVPDNPARFFNHSCEPNCEAVDDEGRIFLVALRDIRPGEELTFNYGYSLADYQDNPCGCGARGCIGYMVAAEFFDEVRRRERTPAEDSLQDR